MPALRSIDFGNVARNPNGKTLVGPAICDGPSLVSRIDFEVIHNNNQGWSSLLRGLRVFCSGGGEPIPINFLGQPTVQGYKLSQITGPLAPNGVRDMIVRSKTYIDMLGYAGTDAGGMGGDSWEQAKSDLAACSLKGVELYSIFWADGVRLFYDCSPPIAIPSRSNAEIAVAPAASPSPRDSPPSSPPVPSSSLPLPISTHHAPPPVTVSVIVPSPTPVTTTVVVGSGANATTIVTTMMVTPPPFTVTFLPSSAASTPIVITAGSAATTVITNLLPPQAVQQDEQASPFLLGSLAGLTLVLLATVLALAITWRRQWRRNTNKTSSDSIELSSRHALPSPMVEERVPPGVDPPSYLTVPIPRPASVEVDLEVPQIATTKCNKVQAWEGA
ncbi:hypothetical protein BCR44DRAFT_90513 [Catenaria anguillulae PL171]|uniref:Uncharacterized protein n=1 Tax=Catenaria anguillulae PL171 TaxID=765915 RepID=A0A1Y2HQ76_9FUNG|nr:hypothetical protein BCR44DRAFT_90513 [Catenaria anguillulae PL171]